MRDITAIGSATRDAFLNVNFKIIPYSKTPTRQAIVIPFGEKFGLEKLFFTIGGNATNASVTFARQGLKTALVTRVGNDAGGGELMLRLKQEGVNTKLISTSFRLPTSYSFLLLEKGERTILQYHGAIDEFSISDIAPQKLKSRWWYVSLPAESYKQFYTLIKIARRYKIAIALNPNIYHITKDRKKLINSLKYVSFLVLNQGEAAALTGVTFSREKALFRKIDKLIPGIVAVTNGKEGVTVSDGKFIYRAGTFKEKNLIDRTGAGDAFGSGFVAGLMRKKETCKKGLCKPANLEYAIRLASANATSVVEHVGATEGILKKRQFENDPRWKKFEVKMSPTR